MAIAFAMVIAGLPFEITCRGRMDSRLHSATIKWNPPPLSKGEAIVGYNIYRSSTSRTSYAEIAHGVRQPTYTDSGLQSGGTYYYVITSIDQAGNESKPSEEIRVAIPQ
jgi:hypothetical protein